MNVQTRVYLAQCLCGPARHCIVANAGEGPADSPAAFQEQMKSTLREGVDQLIAAKTINPWCALCGRRREQWSFECAPTAFATLAEAEPVLRREEEANRKSGAAIQAIRAAEKN